MRWWWDALTDTWMDPILCVVLEREWNPLAHFLRKKEFQ